MMERESKQDTHAWVELGLLFELRELVPQDLQWAQELYSMADEEGDVDGTLHLATLFNNGLGVPVDHDKPVELLRKQQVCMWLICVEH